MNSIIFSHTFAIIRKQEFSEASNQQMIVTFITRICTIIPCAIVNGLLAAELKSFAWFVTFHGTPEDCVGFKYPDVERCLRIL